MEQHHIKKSKFETILGLQVVAKAFILSQEVRLSLIKIMLNLKTISDTHNVRRQKN